MKQFILAATIAAAAQAAAATEGMVTYKTDQSFDDVTFGLESAILDQGLVIDATSHVGEMLERTRGDMTNSLRQQKLQDALQSFEERMNSLENSEE